MEANLDHKQRLQGPRECPTSIFVGPPLQLSRFWVAKGTILGPIWDQNGTMLGQFSDDLAFETNLDYKQRLQGPRERPTSIFVGPPLLLSRFWVAKGTILGPFWAQFGTKNGTMLGQFLDALAPESHLLTGRAFKKCQKLKVFDTLTPFAACRVVF